MNVSEIMHSILDNPDAPQFYRLFQQFYEKNNFIEEANAISHLINSKFEKNHANTPDGQHIK